MGIKTVNMEDKIYQVLRKHKLPLKKCEEIMPDLLDLFSVRLSLFQKNRLDLLNWAKSELKQETNSKLGKTMTPYRSDKIIFLRRIISWINDEV